MLDNFLAELFGQQQPPPDPGNVNPAAPMAYAQPPQPAPQPVAQPAPPPPPPPPQAPPQQAPDPAVMAQLLGQQGSGPPSPPPIGAGNMRDRIIAQLAGGLSTVSGNSQGAGFARGMGGGLASGAEYDSPKSILARKSVEESNAFSGGIPTTADGKTDLDTMAKRYYQMGDPKTGMALENATLARTKDPTWGVIGEDQFGKKTYGWINPSQQTATPNIPPAGTAASQSGPAQTGQAFLDTLDKPTADQVKAYADGRIAFPSGAALRAPFMQRMLQYVSQYDPNFDAVNYNSRSKTRNDFTAGKSAQNITSFNTAIQHLDTLDKSIDPLGNRTSPLYNKLTGAIQSEVDPKYQDARKNFDTAKTALTDELTRAFRGSGGNVHDITEWEKNINAADSPSALHTAVRQSIGLLRGRIEAVADQYNRGMGTTKDPLTLLSPKAQAAINRMEGQAGAGAPPAAAQGAAPALPAAGQVPPSAAAYLKANPNLRQQFDAKYGAGASATVLGQ